MKDEKISPGVDPQTSSPDNVTMEIITTAFRLREIAAEWEALFARCGRPQQVFQSHAFLRHWIPHYLSHGQSPCLIAGWRGGRLDMLWPLVRRKWFGLDVVHLMGWPVAQFGDVLAADPALLGAGWTAIAGLGADLFHARRVRHDAPLAVLARQHSMLETECEQAPYAELSHRVASDGPGMAYTGRDRSNYRRRLRRLAERGDIVFHDHGPGEFSSQLAVQALKFKKANLEGKAIVSRHIGDPRFRAFFEDIAADPASPLRVTALECGGRPVAIDLSFDSKGRCFGHVMASAPRFERDGVGTLLVHASFANASRRGNSVFELLPPADPYKLQHADGVEGVSDFSFAFTRRGRLALELGLRRVRPVAKDLMKNLPPPVAGALLRLFPE